MGTDPISRRIVLDGVLYPCQAIFLAPSARAVSASAQPAEIGSIDEPFVLVEDRGTLLRQKPNATESATLAGLVQVLQRIPEVAPIRYLTDGQVRDLLCADVYHYRELVEDNGAGRLAFHGVTPSDAAGLNLRS
jgi:hypothetical protein